MATAFFDAVRQIAKIEAIDRDTDGEALLDTAVRQIISEHGGNWGDRHLRRGQAGEAGHLGDRRRVPPTLETSDQKNLQLEAVRRLISNDVRQSASAATSSPAGSSRDAGRRTEPLPRTGPSTPPR
ncbi:MAG: hypothetical protein R2731_05815 [Nocardioides sp.]